MAKHFQHTHNDDPVPEDGLQRQRLLQLITDQVTFANPPKVIAVHGTWGSGKTSLLMQLRKELENRYESRKTKQAYKDSNNKKLIVRPVWFEAWQYQNEPNILAALLKEIRDQLSSFRKMMKEIDEAAVPAFLAFLQSIDVTIGVVSVKGFQSKISDNITAYQKERISTPLESATLREMLQEAINKLLDVTNIFNRRNYNVETGKVVVIIDDLDRCEPDTAFKVLEAIKIYLNLNNCVFVLGMDLQAVERIIAKYYEKMLLPAKDGDDNHTRLKDLARLYLEKICQDVYHLPLPDQDIRLAYFQSLLKGKLLENEADEKGIIQKIVDNARNHKFLPPFPRSVKIFANVLISYFNRPDIVEYVKKDKAMERLLIFAYLYAFHYEIYNLCSMYLDKGFYNGTFRKFCDDPGTFKKTAGNKHHLLDTLIVPEDITTQDALGGKTTTEVAEDYLARMFPHESLRQVLWIRSLVMATGDIPDPDQKLLKL